MKTLPSDSKYLDSSVHCLSVIAGFHNVEFNIENILHKIQPYLATEIGSRTLFDDITIPMVAKELQLGCKIIRPNINRLNFVPNISIGKFKDGSYFVYIKSVNEDSADGKCDLPDSVLLQRAGSKPTVVGIVEFQTLWDGVFFCFTSKATIIGNLARFDFSWFIPTAVKYRGVFVKLFLMSAAIQGLGLLTPVFFQTIMDKVLINHAFSTLTLISIGLLFIIIFEGILTASRSLLSTFLSTKIDVELGAKIYRHILKLPISYFEARNVGDSVSRVRELENIRAFITGSALSASLDLIFSFIVIAVMLQYSGALTLIVLASLPVYMIVSIIVTPTLRRRLDKKFQIYAQNNSFLVESISGITTIKSLAIEPRWTWRWDREITAFANSSASVSNLGSIASSSIQVVSRLTTLAIIYVGAKLVINGELTVGELIAFNMLAGQISTPILRISQLWSDFQQVGVSVERLGDVLNALPENSGSSSFQIARSRGNIKFDNVSYQYHSDRNPALRNISFELQPGQTLGIVGRSGSGKSTLSKLIQRFYVPTGGKIYLDDQDLIMLDPVSLRKNIGVVMQESFLFSGTIKENICNGDTTKSIDRVIEVAKISGAHEFIALLPSGYDTKLGEFGTGLSGGQKQRIAIARALISNPPILIFDEATSALDYESERLIQSNMDRISKGRTVIIIAHRLSAVSQADKILVLDKGSIAEIGTHRELMELAGGTYRHLYDLQFPLNE